MTTSALDIITGAARLVGAIFKSETLDSDEANEGLNLLNEMLDSWSNDDLLTYALVTENFSLTGASSYTIGSGGNFNTTRPINIASAVVRYATIDYPLDIISQLEYQTEIPNKTLTAPIPQFLTYDNNYPLGTIKIYAIPTSGSTLYLQSNKPLSNLAALTTTVDLPPGWKEALKNNLALRLAPEYGVEVPADVRLNANLSKGAIKRAISANNPLPFLPAVKTYKSYILGDIT